MMADKIKMLLPAGTVVLLKGASKKIMIIGYLQIKEVLSSGEVLAYDYVAVPYPEGFMSESEMLLFDHEDIETVYFQGFADDERKLFMETVQAVMEKTEETVGNT